MNTVKSSILGWGSLVAAAGVSYYYAKQSINERRKAQEAAGARPTEKLDWRARIAEQETRAPGFDGNSPSVPAVATVDTVSKVPPEVPKANTGLKGS